LTSAQEKLVMAFTMNVLPFALVESPSFLDMFGAMMHANKVKCSAKTLAKWSTMLATSLRDQLRRTVKGKVVVILGDCGTLLRNQLLHLSIGFEGATYFWGSVHIPTPSAMTLEPIFRRTIADLRSLDATVLAIVTDNASGMTRAVEDAIDPDEEEEEVLDVDEEVIVSSEDEEDSLLRAAAPAPAQELDDTLPTATVESATAWLEEFQPEDRQMLDEMEHFFSLQDEGFICHIRCWAHSVQLLMGDIFKTKPGECAMLTLTKVLNFFAAAKNRWALEKAARSEGLPSFSLSRPSETRWNSFLRTMFRIWQLRALLTTLMGRDAPLQVEFETLGWVVVVCAPLGHICNKVQADDITITTCMALLDNVAQRWRQLREEYVQFKHVKALLDSALGKLATRRTKNFNNSLTELFELLDPHGAGNLNALESQQYLLKKLAAYCTDRRRMVDMLSLQTEVNNFITRAAVDHDVTLVEYFARHAHQHHFLSRMVAEINELLLTEAAVERSFGQGARILTKARNRLCLARMNDLTFIKMNGRALHYGEKAAKHKVGRREEITSDEVQDLLETLAPEAKVPTRAGLRSAASLQKDDKLWLLDTTPSGRKVWFEATVLCKVADNNFVVLYDETNNGGNLNTDKEVWKRRFTNGPAPSPRPSLEDITAMKR
jgi:hypothetical protein